MAEPRTPPGDVDGFVVDDTLKRTFLRIVLIEIATVGFLYWMSRYFS